MLHKVWLSQNKGQKIWIRLKSAAAKYIHTEKYTYFFLTDTEEGRCIERLYEEIIMNIGLTLTLWCNLSYRRRVPG